MTDEKVVQASKDLAIVKRGMKGQKGNWERDLRERSAIPLGGEEDCDGVCEDLIKKGHWMGGGWQGIFSTSLSGEKGTERRKRLGRNKLSFEKELKRRGKQCRLDPQ